MAPMDVSSINRATDSDVDILLIGHVTRDLIGQTPSEGQRMGGTVTFAAVVAQKLGRRPTIVTRAESNADLAELPDCVNVCLLPSLTTTTFANIYTPTGRIQYCFTPAPPILAEEIPAAYHTPRAVLLGPLVNEIGPDVVNLFGGQTLVTAVPQGWMRRWDETGRVYSKRWETASAILPHLDALILSLEDIDHDLDRLNPIYDYLDLVVMTEYRDGSTVFQRQSNGSVLETKIPPRTAIEIDPTGAGDTFATAFMIRLQETNDPIEAARFANVTASFSVESEGVGGIPGRDQVLDYMALHPIGDGPQA